MNLYENGDKVMKTFIVASLGLFILARDYKDRQMEYSMILSKSTRWAQKTKEVT